MSECDFNNFVFIIFFLICCILSAKVSLNFQVLYLSNKICEHI